MCFGAVGNGTTTGAIFVAVILDDQQIGDKFGLSWNNNNNGLNHSGTGVCECVTVVQ
jgi:hypothetical protein